MVLEVDKPFCGELRMEYIDVLLSFMPDVFNVLTNAIPVNMIKISK